MHKIKTVTWGLVPFAQLANVIGWLIVGYSFPYPSIGYVSFFACTFLAITVFVAASKITKE